MKITVVTDSKGKVIGSMRQPARQTAGSPTVTIETEKGQQLHDLDIDLKAATVKSVDDLHKILQKGVSRKTRA